MGLIAATTVFQLLSGNLFQVGLRYLVPAVFPSLVGVWLLVLEARRQFGAAPIRAAAIALLVLNTVLPFSWRNPHVRGIHNDDPNVRLHVRLWQVVRDRNPVAKSEWYFSDPIMLNAQAGRWLRDEFLPRHRRPGLVLAADQMGMLGYYAPHDVPIVDMLGLMDRQVASQKFSPYDLALYLLYRGADFIVLYAHRPEERPPWVTAGDVNRAAIHALRPTMEEPPISELYTVWAAIRPANDVESFQFLVYGRREGAPAEPEVVVLGPDTDEFLRAWRVTAPEDVPRMLFD
jgi:hypothetical protein